MKFLLVALLTTLPCSKDDIYLASVEERAAEYAIDHYLAVTAVTCRRPDAWRSPCIVHTSAQDVPITCTRLRCKKR